MSGHSRITGNEVDINGPPIEMAQAVGDLAPGLYAAMSIIAAIRHRDRKGEGQMIDVAQLDVMTSMNMAITGYSLSGMLLHEIKDKYPMGRGFGGMFKTIDGGYIRLAIFSPRLIDDLREHMGVEEVTEELIMEKVSGMKRDEAVDYFVAARIPVAPVYNVDEVVTDPHLIERNMFTTVDHENAGPIKVVNFPVKFSATPAYVKSAAPVIGQHNVEILQGILGYDDSKITELRKANAISG
jgi:crotonobetainyl-CoA:carnitine CoA-transferase CaiB-like acyl-CoA transferase